jgi:hypothetical protein
LRHSEKRKIHLLVGYPLVTENIYQTEHHPITEENEAYPREKGWKPATPRDILDYLPPA